MSEGRRKTTVLLQMEAVECGAASLGIILAYFGKDVPLEDLRLLCGVSRDGSKASNIVRVARQLGLKTQAFKRSADEIGDLPTPAILFWRFNHFLVLEGVSEKKVYLNDPASGHRIVSRETFVQSYSGIILTFSPVAEFVKTGKRPSVLKQLYRFLWIDKGTGLFLVAFFLFLAVSAIVAPALLWLLIDRVLVYGYSHWALVLAGGFLVTFGVLLGIQLLCDWLLVRLGMKSAVLNSCRFVWQMFALPFSFFNQRSVGEVISRVPYNNDVSDYLLRDLLQLCLLSLSAFVYAVVMVCYHPLLAFLGIVLGGVQLLILGMVDERRQTLSQRLLIEHGNLEGFSSLGLQSIDTIKATGVEHYYFSRWSGFLTKTLNTQQRVETAILLLQSVPEFLSGVNFAVLLTVGSIFVVSGTLSMGMLVAFLVLLGLFLTPLQRLARMGPDFQKVKAYMTRLNDVLMYHQGQVASESPAEEKRSVGRLKGHLQILSVSFGYSRLETPLLKQFDLKLSPGSRVALVGPTGSGKSTVVKLLAGLFEIWEGKILLDDRPYSSYPKEVLGGSLAFVNQTIFLFEGSIKDNLTLWDESISQEAIVQAAKDACIHDDILALPGGYDAVVEEAGQNFSGGQRQRLEIARALAQDPSVLILDEATSALDAETEYRIDQNLRKRGCTCLIIAHRLSTIRDADEIIVLKSGQIVERGSHRQLMKQKGLYHGLIET